jgi:hypothetical protein
MDREQNEMPNDAAIRESMRRAAGSIPAARLEALLKQLLRRIEETKK